MIFDIQERILQYLIIYEYRFCLKLKNVSKVYKTWIENKEQELNKYTELQLLSEVKVWRSELDQQDYFSDDFILCDNETIAEQWFSVYKEQTSSAYYITKRLYNMHNSYKIYSSNEFYTSIDDNISLKKLKYDIYFIYYFRVYNFDSYGFSIMILPYFDENILNRYCIHSNGDNIGYKQIKKNGIYSHTVINNHKINNIEF